MAPGPTASLIEAPSAVREKAERTPASRERHVDLLRAVAICVVVIGHGLVFAVSYQNGELDGENALNVLTWAHPLTWLFQVMPIFFLVGGYANAASMTSHLERGGDSVSWLLRRTDRLLRPTTPLFVLLPLSAIVARLVGVDTDLIGSATWLATIPLWFLLAYMTVVVLTPVVHGLHRRFGLGVLAVLLTLVAAADVPASIGDVPYVGDANYLFFWLAIHQLGFSWQAGRLPRSRCFAVGLILAGGVALVAATVAGPYETLMVGGNAEPPTLALLALATTQTGIVLLVWPASERWLGRIRPWTAVVAVNSVVLTIFVWHMAAAAIAAVLLYPTGVMPQPDIDSAAWLLWRMPWIAFAGLILLLFISIFGQIEMRRPPIDAVSRGPVRDAATAFGLAATLGGLLGVAMSGEGHHGPGGLHPGAVIPYLAGAAVLRVVRSGGSVIGDESANSDNSR